MQLSYIPKGHIMLNYSDYDIMVAVFGNSNNTYVDKIEDHNIIEGIYDMKSNDLIGFHCEGYRTHNREKELASLIKKYASIDIKLLPLQRLQDFE